MTQPRFACELADVMFWAGWNHRRVRKMTPLWRSAGARLAIAAAAISGCSGPQPLPMAIQPEQQQVYATILRDHPTEPGEAFLAWKATQSGLSIDDARKADRRISTTRNPFNARRDPEAVSMGAVIYVAHCMVCHGTDARGRGPSMPTEIPRMDFHSPIKRMMITLHNGAPRAWFRKVSEGFTSKIRNPDGTPNTMTAFGDVLTREQIWLAITYLQSLDIDGKTPADTEGD